MFNGNEKYSDGRLIAVERGITALEGHIATGNESRKAYNFKPKET
jgi:hypothetical protein